MSHVKKDDNVLVISGGHKGKTGVILSVNPTKSTVLIKGIHMIKKHVKKSQTSEGGIIEKEGPIHISNVRLAEKPAKETAKASKASKAAKPAAKKAPAKKRAKAATE
jgi:large subunit ribosomal protein L24